MCHSQVISRKHLVETGFSTHCGGGRQNQDTAMGFDEPYNGDDLHLFSLADGMGGHRYGALASQMACAVLIGTVRRLLHKNQGASESDLSRYLIEAMYITDRAVRRCGRKKSPPSCMGSTPSCLLLLPNTAWWTMSVTAASTVCETETSPV